MLQLQIDELLKHYDGLAETNRSRFGITLSGPVAFNASHQESAEISDSFEIEAFIPYEFPESHPVVWDATGKLDADFGHVNPDGTFCLAVPLDINEALDRQPTLLGFFDSLVVPFLYSYSHWKRFGVMPFGERSHGEAGFLEYYLELFSSTSARDVLIGVISLLTDGYRPHEKCPCGSGRKTLRCHTIESKKIAKSPYKDQMTYEIKLILHSLKNK